MKTILLLTAALGLFAATGCIFVGHRDRPEDRDHTVIIHEGEPHPHGVDHGEYPNDVEHQERP
jgi:hypothetical protein